MKIKGTTFDDTAFDKAVKERWEKVGNGFMRCTKHDTFFRYDGSDEEEPCWACYHEFEKEV